MRDDFERFRGSSPRVPKFNVSLCAEEAFAVLRSVVDGIDIARTDFAVLDITGADVVPEWNGGCHVIDRSLRKQLLHHRSQLRIIPADTVAGLRQRASRNHKSACTLEFEGFLQGRVPDGFHRGQDKNLVDIAGNMEFLPDHFRTGQRLEIHEVEIDSLPVNVSRGIECGVHGQLAIHARLDRGDWIENGHVTTVVALRQQIGEALLAIHEALEMFPIRHAERVVRRRPFPPPTVGGVIHAMKA